MLPLVPYNAVFGVYRLQHIPTFRMSARTRTSTIPSSPVVIPSIDIAIPNIPRAIPFYGFTLVVREPNVRSYVVCGNIMIKGDIHNVAQLCCNPIYKQEAQWACVGHLFFGHIFLYRSRTEWEDFEGFCNMVLYKIMPFGVRSFIWRLHLNTNWVSLS